MFANFRKKRVKSAYDLATRALQLSLYEIIVSILKDELGKDYPIEKIKDAAAVTVNKLGLRHDSRSSPLDNNDDLAKSLSNIIELTMIKEAVALILFFSYFTTEKTEEKYLEKAKELRCSDFETIYKMLDIDTTSPDKIKRIASAISNKLHEAASFDIRNNF